MKWVCVVAILAATSGIASAADWSAADDKGLKTYTLAEAETRLELVCDPDLLWEPPEFHLVVKRNGEVLDGPTLTAAKDAESVTLTLTGGAVVAQDRDAWNKLIALISNPGTVSFEAEGESFSVTFDDHREGNCSRPPL